MTETLVARHKSKRLTIEMTGEIIHDPRYVAVKPKRKREAVVYFLRDKWEIEEKAA